MKLGIDFGTTYSLPALYDELTDQGTQGNNAVNLKRDIKRSLNSSTNKRNFLMNPSKK